MGSTILFHGPGARAEALDYAESHGRLLTPGETPDGQFAVFGDTSKGLYIGDPSDKKWYLGSTRYLVEMLSSAPVGDRKGIVVVGAMDGKASVGALDALLKFLEEHDERFVQPILWAWDVGVVRETIRSRCSEKWSPGHPGGGPEVPYMKPAKELCEAALRRKVAAVVEILKENKGSEVELLRASARVLMEAHDWPWPARMTLWERIRPLLSLNPEARVYETLAAYLV